MPMKKRVHHCSFNWVRDDEREGESWEWRREKERVSWWGSDAVSREEHWWEPKGRESIREECRWGEREREMNFWDESEKRERPGLRIFDLKGENWKFEMGIG